jgi:cytochrome c5
MEGQIMRTFRLSVSCFFFAAVFALAFEAASLAATPSAAAPRKQDKQARPQPESNGERVFHQNCSRCHNAPEGFPPEISGTILRHMRVRANLSHEDEQALLKFFNP